MATYQNYTKKHGRKKYKTSLNLHGKAPQRPARGTQSSGRIKSLSVLAALLCFPADSQTVQQITRIKKQPFWLCSSTLTSGDQSGKDRQTDRQTHPSLCSALIKMLTEFVMWTCFFHFSIMYNEHCDVTCLAGLSVWWSYGGIVREIPWNFHKRLDKRRSTMAVHCFQSWLEKSVYANRNVLCRILYELPQKCADKITGYHLSTFCEES